MHYNLFSDIRLLWSINQRLPGSRYQKLYWHSHCGQLPTGNALSFTIRHPVAVVNYQQETYCRKSYPGYKPLPIHVDTLRWANYLPYQDLPLARHLLGPRFGHPISLIITRCIVSNRERVYKAR